MWREIPSKSGMGLSDAQVAELIAYAKKFALTVSNDVRAWDTFAPHQILKMEAECRIELNGAKDQAWENAVRCVTILHAHRIVMLSDGRCFKRSVLGGQASGRKVTSSSNGRARGLLDILTAQEFGYEPAFMTQGDDNVAFYPEAMSEQMIVDHFRERFGITMTDVVRSDEKIHFCSQEMYTRDGAVRCVPERPQKQFATLLMSITSPGRLEALESLEANLRHHPQLEAYRQASRVALGMAA
jgi:hypothetical protein